MNNNIRLLDCTLRDGAYIVDAKFGSPVITGIIKKSEEADIEIIECGWLKNSAHEEGTSFFHVPDDLKRYITKKKKSATYVVMIDWDRYDLSQLPEYDGGSVDAVRVVFPHGKHREGISVGKAIMDKGYKVFYQAANTLAYSDEELKDLAEEANKVMPVCLSVVDTFGAMYAEDLERIVNVLDKYLAPEIDLGFHSHNNQQLSFALTMHFTEILKGKRGIIVDASLCGMGRGAGNATTELVASYLNRKHSCNYDMNAIMDAIDIYMESFKENYSWGYSTPYFIAGMYCCHVNNIAYLLKNHRTSSKDMRNIIESLSPEDRRKYDYDLLESKYLENQCRKVNDEDTVIELAKEFDGRKILLIAPGKSSVDDRDKIKAFIDREKPVVIGVNAFLPGYEYDYVFLTNSARYEYAQSAYPEQFAKTKKLLLSNIKTEPSENELVISFERIVKRGWEHFDNAVISCLRFMDKLHIGNVFLAGFDGFRHKYNESYGDALLPAINTSDDWDALNDEIYDMFSNFKNTSLYCKNIEFLTDSIFNK